MLNSNIDYDELKNFLAQRINIPLDGFYSRFYYDGIYEIKFNELNECVYFKSWEMVK